MDYDVTYENIASPPPLLSYQMANHMAIKRFQCEYNLLHRQAKHRRGAESVELGRGEERTEALESWGEQGDGKTDLQVVAAWCTMHINNLRTVIAGEPRSGSA